MRIASFMFVITSVSALQLFGVGNAVALTNQEQVGKLLFHDTNLSEPAGQACASCHAASAGFADPDQNIPVSEGVIVGRFGGRNTPTAAYAAFSPTFTTTGGIKGGQFWDGRAATLSEQAKGPFLASVEMNNTSRAQVVGKVAASSYASLFQTVCGVNAFLVASVDSSYNCMADAIASYERTSELSPFTSKYDAVERNQATLTVQEQAGLDLFTGRGKCGHCHSLAGGNAPDLFSDFKYSNIGLPNNPEIFALLGRSFVDLGLGATLNNPKHNGKFKTSHLRNIAKTAPYMHNGVLKTLKDVVHFYNTRDISGLWPAPEVPETIDSNFVGNLGLTDAEENAIVAFMMNLTDGWVP